MHPLLRKALRVSRDPELLLKKLSAFLANLVWSHKRKVRLLATWQMPAGRSRFDRLAFDGVFERWINDVYKTELDPDRRETLKDICMSGSPGVSWAETYDQRAVDRSINIGELSFDEACPWILAMDRFLASVTDKTLVLQIGCSSGREMAYFACRFPSISFVGTDIDQFIVGRAARKYARSNLSFDVTRAHRLLDVVPQNCLLVIYSNGSLQYVQPEHLQMMFERIQRRGNVEMILGEPWCAGGSRIGVQPSRWRGNFSFSHDYRDYAERAGFAVKEAVQVQPYLNPNSEHFGTCHYFLRASAAPMAIELFARH